MVNDKSLDEIIRWANQNNISEDKLPRGKERLKKLTILDLTNCKSLKSLPEDIKYLNKLTKLKLYAKDDTFLAKMIDVIKDCNGLESLFLIGNFTILPKNIRELKNLIKLKLDNCRQLKSLENIDKLENLKEFYLNYNLLETISEIVKLNKLIKLNLSGCSFLESLDGIDKLESLKELKIYAKDNDVLGKMINAIQQCNGLESLSLKGNFNAIPWDSIKNLKNLKRLTLVDCESLIPLDNIAKLEIFIKLKLYAKDNTVLVNMMNVIRQCNNLKSLSIKGNFTIIPDSVGKLEKLKELDIAFCESLRSLPEDIKYLNKLTKLKLYAKDDEVLENAVKTIKHCSALKCLFLKGNFTTLPNNIGELKNLISLTLINCKSLKSISENIGKLENPIELNISNCSSLQSLPEDIKGLKNLTSLALIDCKSLRSLPNSIGGLQNLERLNIINCKSIQSLPNNIGKLKYLTNLDISNCISLKSIPASIGELKNLEKLNIMFCKSLQSLPMSIGELKYLTSLNLSGCTSLQTIPASIGELKYLKSLNLSNCEFLESIPENISELEKQGKLEIVR